MRLFAAVVAFASIVLSGCPKDVSSEDRLDRETRRDAVTETPDAEALAKLDCKNIEPELNKARSDTATETNRVLTYIELYDELRKKTQTFEDAMSRNPDLAFKEGSQEIVAARDTCVQQSADVRVEFERYVRELVDVPIVDEVKGGATVKVARLEMGALRQAIDVLSPDDKDQLLARVASAEKKVQASGEKAEPRKKR